MDGLSRRRFISKSALLCAGSLGIGALNPVGLLGQVSRPTPPRLLVPPYLGIPTGNSVVLNLMPAETPLRCRVKYREIGGRSGDKWRLTPTIDIEALTPKEITLDGLGPGIRYQYQVLALEADPDRETIISEDSFITLRKASEPFSFGLFSDAHITPFNDERKVILSRIGRELSAKQPDFALMLGDNIQTFTSHGGPMTESRFGPILYAHLRDALGALPSSIPLFNVIGNWEGENGWHSEIERDWARQARKQFIPTPDPTTYPDGGGRHGEYYGFQWGDALFLSLTVASYTPNTHAMQSPVGQADDWTLGAEQRTWFHDQLKKSTAKWKLVFIHHTVGGNAGDDVNSRYGRGGGRAAKVGEQALIHEWMKKYGAQALFYGHDHVFTDIPVDGIHYICVGSAGAPWKFDETITGYDTYWTPFGFTTVDVENSRLKVSFNRQDGALLHSFFIV